MSTIEADAAGVLRKAADHIEAVGLFQGTWFAPNYEDPRPVEQRPCCVLGAVGYEAGYWIPDPESPSAYTSPPLYGPDDDYKVQPEAARASNLNEVARWALGYSLALDYPDFDRDEGYDGAPAEHIHPPDWNDAEGRTKEEAVAALRAAADRLDAGTLGDYPAQRLPYKVPA